MKEVEKRFEVEKEDMRNNLDILEELLERAGEEKTISWAHVGSLAHVNEGLEEVIRFFHTVIE
jgi:hypothetical protein